MPYYSAAGAPPLDLDQYAADGTWRNGRMKPKPERRKPKRSRAEPAPRPELEAASRAQLGRDEERRPYRPREEDASIEDPLQDWPKEE